MRKTSFCFWDIQRFIPYSENKNRDGIAIPIFFRKPVTYLKKWRLISGTNKQGTRRGWSMSQDFAAACQVYYDRVYRFLLALSGDPNQAED